jgi:hypothetical protein
MDWDWTLEAAASKGSIVPATGDKWVLNIDGVIIGRRTPRHLKKSSLMPSFHHKSHTDYPGIGEKPATSPLSYCKVSSVFAYGSEYTTFDSTASGRDQKYECLNVVLM